MPGCLIDQLAADISNNCDYLAIPGIEEDVVLIPYSNFDKASSTINGTNRMLIDNLQCKSGTSGYLVQGVKQVHGFNQEFVPSEETVDKWRHVYQGVIMTPSTANRLQASKLARGESYVVVIHRKYKGVSNADAFLILGWDNGLYVTEMTENSREGEGAIRFTLSSKDDALEYDMARNLLETDYDTTLTAFNNKFAEA